ncbi:MAG TPA: tol-pal system-associated acyl-CoA thioesterase [Candidatus Aquabacterium excrementipullorum]|nr:tol-pal system-associated acyl-CoA thioesterase [Candidatus Aquabacterium excrementipullorum]
MVDEPLVHFRWPVRVYWEDTDAGGVVFYANYLKFFERARTEWLRSLGPAQEGMRRAGQGMFVVSETRMRYLRPARLDDELTVTVCLTEKGRASLTLVQQCWRAGTLLVEGDIRIGWVVPQADDALRPARMPAEVLAALPVHTDAAQS